MSSNIGQVVAWLDKFVDSFDFKRPGNDQNLGRDIAHKAVELIQDRSLVDRTGFGTAWQPNSETPHPPWQPQGYRKWKEDNYGVGEPNSRTGQMLSKKSLFGRTAVDSKQVTMIYGTDTPPDRATFGNPTAKQFERDQKVTDCQKAYFAHTGQSKKKIVRPFYQLIDSDGAAIVELAQENLNDLIRDTNAANGY
jgi:hypothetical protein